MRCEDYPCCGHTSQDPCERQPYDEPGYFDTSRNPHALCDHENGECDAEYYDVGPDESCDGDENDILCQKHPDATIDSGDTLEAVW